MSRHLELALTDFSRSALEREARRYGLPVATVLARAALYYLLERRSERLAARVPRLSQDAPGAGENSILPVTIELRASEWSELNRIAAGEGISVERLLEHAMLLFLADLESGQVAARVLEVAEAEPD